MPKKPNEVLAPPMPVVLVTQGSEGNGGAGDKARAADALKAGMAAGVDRTRQAAQNMHQAVADALGRIRPEHLIPALHALGLQHLVSQIPQTAPGQPMSSPTTPGPEADPKAWLAQMALSGGLGVPPGTALNDAAGEQARIAAAQQVVDRSNLNRFMMGLQGLNPAAAHPTIFGSLAGKHWR